MKQTVNFNQFTDAFRSIRPDNFTYDGLRALYDYFEQYGEDTGAELELDVIAFCCEYTEFEGMKEFQEAYGSDYKTLEDVENATTIMPAGDGFVIQNF